jgi:hypothetical protein
MRPKLHTTASKLPSAKVSDWPSSTTTEAFGEPARRWRPIDHGLGVIGSRDVAAGADHGDCGLRRDPCTGRDVEHVLAGLKTGRPQEERQEMRGDMSDGLVVCGCSLVLE